METKYLKWILIFMTGCNTIPANENSWTSLFNGQDLTGWETYLGPKYDTVEKKFRGEPIGLNTDPFNVFTVVEEDGESAIRISGQYFGGISTKKEYANYHFQLEFKWGEPKYIPRDSVKRDSGLLYHGVGEHGVNDKFWLRSQECQIQEGDCGDYWGVGNARFDIPVSKESEYKVFSKGGEIKTFSTESDQGRHCIKYPDAEKPTGEWNTVELFSFGDTSVHVVNGVVNMILYNSRYFDGTKEVPLKKGKFQIQSEGAEVYYRNLKVRPIFEMPETLFDSQAIEE